jgi:hypothetical protein
MADSFFRNAGLIGLLPARFFWALVVFFVAALPFCLAHRARCAAAILALADALILRRFCPVDCPGWLALGGRPRRSADWEPSPTSAAIARSIRLASCLSCPTKL